MHDPSGGTVAQLPVSDDDDDDDDELEEPEELPVGVSPLGSGHPLGTDA